MNSRNSDASLDCVPNITEALNHLVDWVNRGRVSSGSLSLLGSRYQVSPYVQFVKSGNFLASEMVSNSFLETRLTAWEESQILHLGWNAPTKSKPNFWKDFESSPPREVAEFLVLSMRVAYGLNPKSWFTFGSSSDEIPLIESGLFWHSRNNRHILCLPGNHIGATVETQSSQGA